MATQDQHQVPYSFQFQLNVFKAAKNGNLTILKGLLNDKQQEEVLRLVSFKTKGVTPLIISCLGTGDPDRNHVLGIWEVVDYLVNKCGASIEQTGSIKLNGEMVEGVPPLWCAVAAGHLYIVKLLVESGANVNSANSMGQTCLMIACTRRYQGCLEGFSLHDPATTYQFENCYNKTLERFEG